MSIHDYRQSIAIDQLDASFDALIMAAARKADTAHYRRLVDAFPTQVLELKKRYNAPGGRLDTDSKETA
jgi:hypothetical protein